MTAIIFDLDGTLIDSAPDLHRAANLALHAEGLPEITFEQARGFIGRGAPVLISRVMQAVGLGDDREAHERLLAGFMTHYEAEPGLTVVYPGVVDALARLVAMGCPLGLCTNKPEGPTRIALRHFGFDGLMTAVATGDTLDRRKPDPAPLHHVLAEMGVQTGLYVGDSETDAETAQAAGVPFALYTEGYRKTPVAELPHSYAFDHFDQLPDIVARHRATLTA